MAAGGCWWLLLLMLRACRSVLPVRSPLCLPESAENVLFPGAPPLASAGVGGYLICRAINIYYRISIVNSQTSARVAAEWLLSGSERPLEKSRGNGSPAPLSFLQTNSDSQLHAIQARWRGYSPKNS